MKNSTKRLYLRLLDVDLLDKTEDELLTNVRKKVEEVLPINWLQEPSIHPKGGYKIIGKVPDNIDFDSLPLELKKVGFLVVI